MTDWTQIASLYPVNQERIWLNNCGTVPAGNHTIRAVNNYLKAYGREGVFAAEYKFDEVRQEILGYLAKLLGCETDELALIHHTAEGMNFFSHGIPLQAGDEVLLLADEYPSNIYPWWHLKHKGIGLRTIPLADTPEKFLQNVLAMIGPRTKVVSLSAVHWCTGMPLPLAEVGRCLQQNDIYFVVDGAQGVGHIDMDLSRLPIDFMAFSAWKWLMGPLGLGVLFVRRNRLDSLKPEIIGTGSVVNELEYLPYKKDLKPSASRFSISTPNFVDWIYFRASLRKLNEIGFARVQERVLSLAAMLADGLRAAGCTVSNPPINGPQSGMVLFTKEGVDTGRLMRHFTAHQIVGAERQGRIRLSPHIYNTHEQLETVIEETRSIE